MIDSKANIILIAGGSGLIGSELSKILRKEGYEVRILSRNKANHDSQYYYWNTKEKYIDTKALEGNPIIINLAGENIASGLWTTSRKKIIKSSRIEAIQTILHQLKLNQQQAELIINASAIGIYGDQDDTILDEDSNTTNTDFLSEVVSEWENEADTMMKFTHRLVKLRIGLVLSKDGGVWPKFVLLKRIFNWIGTGQQYYSWIHIEDLCRSILHIIKNQSIQGPINLCSTEPIRAKELIKNVQEQTNGFSIAFGIPSFALKLILGQLSNIVLHSQRIIPKKLIQSGFKYKYPNIKIAIQNLIN